MSETQANAAVAALVKATMAMPNPNTDSRNGAFKRHDGKAYKYASLNAFLDVIKPVLAEHGLAMFQPVSTNPTSGMIEVQTMFMHVSGSQVTFPPLAMPIHPGMTCQQAGANISYMRRYSLQSALGLAADDDDADDDRAAHLASKPSAQAVARSAPVDAPQGVQASGGGGGSPKPSQARTAAPSASSAASAFGEVDMVGTVTFLEVKDGVGKNGKPYKRARVGLKPADGGEVVYASAFGASLLSVVTEAKESGQPLQVSLKDAGKFGFDLVTANYAQPAAAQIGDDSDIPF